MLAISSSVTDVQNISGICKDFVCTVLTDERRAKLSGAKVPGQVKVTADAALNRDVVVVSHVLILPYTSTRCKGKL